MTLNVIRQVAGDMKGLTDTDLVDVLQFVPRVVVDLRYAGSNNFTGAPLPGYCSTRALLLRRSAQALGKVATDLEQAGYGLKVWDAYRPVRATEAMVQWAERNDKVNLLDNGYIARRSNHNLGTTVDLTLIRLSDCAEVDMGTHFDEFNGSSHTASATGQVKRNRDRLTQAMAKHGFTNYPKEWWHFDFHQPGQHRLDLPLCG